MYQKTAHNQYQNVHVSTIDRGRLLLMMYDGCIKFLRLAQQGLESKDIVKFARFLSKAQAIIAELINTLDFEKGGSIAKDLDRLYDFMLFYLTEANIHKDSAKIQRVIDLVLTVSSAYKDIIESGKAATELAAFDHGTKQPGATKSSAPSELDKTAPLPGQTLRVSY